MIILYYLILSCLYGLTAYLVSMSYQCAIAVTVLFLITGYVYICPAVIQHKRKSICEENAFAFINRFVICYSATTDEELSYKTGVESFAQQKEFKRVSKQMSNFDIGEKLVHLKKYFGTNYYSVFVSLHNLYIEQGGDYLSILDSLLKEGSMKQQQNIKVVSKKRRILSQFITLWITSLLIMVFIRFALRGYYDNLSTNTAFVVIAYAYFILTVISFALFTRKYTELPLSKQMLGDAYAK